MTGRVAAVEAGKLARQPVVRLVAVLAAVAPFVFAAVLRGQSGAPTDTLFGVGVHSSGAAVSLVVLGFSSMWVLPLIAGVLAGDVFSAEDRHGTWGTILTRSVTRDELLAGKALAVAAACAVLVLVSAVASVAAGLVFEGGHALIGLDGNEIGAARAVGLTLLSWLLCLAPTLALAAVGLLVSLVSRSGIAGVLAPSLLNLLGTLLAFVGSGIWVNAALVTGAQGTWHALFGGASTVLLVVGLLVCVGWTAACLLAARRVLARRELGGEEQPARRAPVTVRAAALVGLVAVLALAQGIGPAGVTQPRLERDVAGTFDDLARLQQEAVGQTPAPVRAGARCRRRADRQEGPGEWTCVLSVLLTDANGVSQEPSRVSYDLSVQSDGCYRADSPPSFIGQPTLRLRGRTVANPLYTFYGCFDIT